MVKKTYNLNSGDEIKVSATKQRESTKLLDGRHWAYSIVIERNKVRRSFTFHDSIYNFSHGIGATESMIDNELECIISDADSYLLYGSPYEFAEEFGYDIEEEFDRAEKIYNACKRTWFRLNDLMTRDEFEDLANMIRNGEVATE